MSDTREWFDNASEEASHTRFQFLAEHPEVIDNIEEREILAVHLQECASCRLLFEGEIIFDQFVVAPVRKRWRHLSEEELKNMKRAGFDPGNQSYRNLDEWHVIVCSDCKQLYQNL